MSSMVVVGGRVALPLRPFGYHLRVSLFDKAEVLTGPRFDDLIPEESDVVQKAIKRLPSKEAYDRVFRIRRAFQVGP